MSEVTLHNDDCVNVFSTMDDESVDLIVTSPPYWNQKSYSYWETYADYMSDVQKWVRQCHRVLKRGRYCFWVIPDKLPWPPSENGTRERLYMPVYADTEMVASDSGFVCEFPIIWDKRGPNLSEQPWSKKMWGSYPYPVSIIHTPFTERICVWRKRGHHGLSQHDRDNSKITSEQFNDWARDIWSIRIESGNWHPAAFPVEIPVRILTLWSCLDDLVLDPFMGSGRTGIACIDTGRNFIGIEIDSDFFSTTQSELAIAQANAMQLELELV